MRVTVKPNTYIYLVILLFFLPIKWIAAWLAAVSFHELCHWGAVRLCGGSVLELSVGISGAKMVCEPLPDRKRLFCVLSGPVGGFLLVLLGRWMPRTALCSWVLSVYNLLPFLFLDGGKVLEILLGAEKVNVIETIFLGVLSLTAVYAAFVLGFGVLPLAVIAALWFKRRKSPCKPRLCKVQ